MYTFENLIDDVKKEAAALKVHATKEELGMLDVNNFHCWGRHSCIYGLATGDCHSKRAALLINKCTPRFFTNHGFSSIRDEGFDGVVKRVNGKKVAGFVKTRISDELTGVKHFSAIEAYILLPEAKNANLIAYLKGETETLEL